MKTKLLFIIMIFSLMATNCKKEKKIVGIDVNNMDLNVRAQDDFYNYVNGGWMAKTEIPEDEARWGSFNELREKNDEMTLALVDKALNDKTIEAKTDEGKVVVFFKTAMDTIKLDANGIVAVQPILDKIESIKTAADVTDYTIAMEPYLGGLWGIAVYSDMKNSNINALYLGGGSLGLPERDYYLNDDDDSKEKREKYVTHITRMLQFLGDTEAGSIEQAERILAFETKMAESMLSKEERRDPAKVYNPMQMEALEEIVPSVQWKRYFAEIGAENFNEIIVSQPDYLKRVEELLQSEPISTVKEYLRWNALNDASGYLSQEIEEANFDFYGKTLSGLKAMKPRNERVLQTTNGVLGEALGKLYVKEYFPEEAKQTAKDMVENIRIAFGNRIDKVDWMSDDTKKMAHKKLESFKVKIGYPDKWKDYSKLEAKSWEDGGSYYLNILNARKWNFDQNIVKIGKEVDKSEWFMPPQMVNAYYNPLYNEIVFPAAILQSPFFDFKADAAINFGGMGAVIGHEISHGFDDKGSKFDAKGNLNNWWTDEDRATFDERGKLLIAQYDAYKPFDDLSVNGEFTLGENIGDLGGVEVAFDGLQLHLADVENIEKIDGFTQNQRFFINWATIWRTKYRDEALKRQIKTDPHSPGQYRAIGPLVNVDEFFEAFNIQDGDPIYKAEEDRIRIW